MTVSHVRLVSSCNPQSTHHNNVKVPALMGTKKTQQLTLETIVRATVRLVQLNYRNHVLRVQRSMPLHQLTHRESVSVLKATPPAQTL